MILETTQLINNALIAVDSEYIPVYKQSHKNHPCSLWTSKSKQNFDWLMRLGLSLCQEYTFRYNKIHKCQSILENLSKSDSVKKLPNIGLQDFCLCMPDEFKVENNPVQSYMNYYKGSKAAMSQWKNRETPDFMREVVGPPIASHSVKQLSSNPVSKEL